MHIGNIDCTRDNGTMKTEKMHIAERARKFTGEALTNLHQFITLDDLHKSYKELNKYSSAGTDGKDWFAYGMDRANRFPKLLSEFKAGVYKVPPIRRVYIPKGKDNLRPLGIPTIEDKVLQSSVLRVLEPIYEAEFKDFSYGFRTGRSAHDAINYLHRKVSFEGMHYIIDADIQDYFGSIDHGILRSFLDRRVKDGVIRKMIDKWLKAGVLEDKELFYQKEGTPQGGIISPLLSNIYLHYVLDVWFSEMIQPLLSGKSFIVRYADDFVLGFANKLDAERVMKVLTKRFGKYKLDLHPGKTKLINLSNKRNDGVRSFDFLGFTHYLGFTRKGKQVLKRKTSKKKFTQSISRVRDWIRSNRHIKLSELIKDLNAKLRGHYSYYGITFNYRGLLRYYEEVKRILYKWLNRRGGRPVWNWNSKLIPLVTEWLPLLKPKIYHSSFL
jgi:RNA-directed DNA polymerase